MRIPWAFSALMGIGAPAPVAAQIAGSASGVTYDVDLRKAAEENGAFGVDFDVRYDRERSGANPQGNHYGFGLKVAGFQALGGTPDVNEMFGEITLRGRYYRSGLTVPSAWQQTRYRQLAECDPAAREPTDTTPVDPRCADFTPSDWVEYQELFRRLRSGRRFFSYDVHYRYETTQDLSEAQHVFGLGLSGELPRLAEALDVIPALTRGGSSGLRPQEVRAYAGIDHVDPQSDVALFLGAASPFWRARWEMAWNTQIFSDFVLRATWFGHYLFDVPQPVKTANRTFNSFLQLWVNYPLSSQTGLLIKYVTGRVPPEYKSSSMGALGFSITLQ